MKTTNNKDEELYQTRKFLGTFWDYYDKHPELDCVRLSVEELSMEVKKELENKELVKQ